MSGPARRILTTALTVLGALAAALLVFLSLYRWDNKYTQPGPKALAGLLYLDGGQAEGLHFLTSEWEYYPDVLLAPGDFGVPAPQPEQYVFIGGYSNFSAGQAQRGPHGQASYRLTVRLPEQPRAYALLMPDVYCAYRLYVNGRLLLEMGAPEADGYTPRLGERTVAFEASGSVEILLAVAGREYITAGLTH
ncbi:ATP-binding protein, partial [Ruminococcaceae bacterium OttesenSCG-928-D13]|nr:ATP-binding protein [Ruminococcaceae bacterium OttesenSCG-928-D13]